MTPRPAALATLAGLVLSSVLAVAPAAHAAWRTEHTFHGAKLQLCKAAPWRIKVRVDNRNGDHTHHGSVGYTRNGDYDGVQVRAAAGRVSKARTITYRAGDELSWGGGEGEGINFGDLLRPAGLPRC